MADADGNCATPPCIRDLLDAGYTLLEPPAPIPSAPLALLDRLRNSAANVPVWRNRPAWNEDDELELIGIDSDADTDPVKRKQRRDELVLIVGERCVDLVVGLQWWLSKEFWPVNLREGLSEKDCTFKQRCYLMSFVARTKF